MKIISEKMIFPVLIPFLVSGLLACGGGGGGNGEGGDGNDSDDDGIVETNRVPVADAGVDMQVSRGFTVNLDASNSSDADGDSLTYTWTQVAGPEVNGGSLSGVTPAFIAPSEVGTVIFELVVNDGTEDSPADTITINVFEDVNVSYFVDGDNGSDSDGSGSMDNPFASIAKALCEVTADQQDIYVMTRSNDEAYDETTDPCPGDPARDTSRILSVATGTSIYGGYDENWVRDHQNRKTPVIASHHGFRFAGVDLNAWFSGFDVQAGDSTGPGDSVFALRAIGGSGTLEVSDNRLTAGDVGSGVSTAPGSSYGMLVAWLENAVIERNSIMSGLGGDGLDVGNIFSTEAARGSPGNDTNGRNGAGGGDGKGPGDFDGGAGGDGGGGLGGNGITGGRGQGAGGGNGGSGGTGDRSDNGSVGANGGPGGKGAAGGRGNGSGSITTFEDGGFFAFFSPGKGIVGNRGGDGFGGGGGGGGEAAISGLVGGGGGGGGGGGAGGSGGPGAPGGGASIGIFIAEVTSSSIKQNIISSFSGGVGASGGQGQTGGDGGVFGTGGPADCFLGGCGGNGGRGGSGGKGGTGGRGGAGGGGPSYGIAVGGNIAPSITDNEISSGEGGIGGFGGAGGNGGNGGYSYAVYDDDINDGVVPVLSNNTLSFGMPGDGGGTTGNGGSIGSSGQSATINW